jgi:hypothetical protein
VLAAISCSCCGSLAWASGHNCRLVGQLVLLESIALAPASLCCVAAISCAVHVAASSLVATVALYAAHVCICVAVISYDAIGDVLQF